jgi:hypothetical protein
MGIAMEGVDEKAGVFTLMLEARTANRVPLRHEKLMTT